jgi:hypothetical protein
VGRIPFLVKQYFGFDTIVRSQGKKPIEVATVISDLYIFLLVLPHVYDSLVAKAFKVQNFKFSRAFFLYK